MAEHEVFDFLLKSLFNFLDVHYQGNGIASPFQTHPITMELAFACLFLYCISRELNPSFAQAGLAGMRLFRSILIVSLASLLFRNPVWFVLCSGYVLFWNWETFCSLSEALGSWVHRRMVHLLYRATCWIIWRRWFGGPVMAIHADGRIQV